MKGGQAVADRQYRSSQKDRQAAGRRFSETAVRRSPVIILGKTTIIKLAGTDGAVVGSLGVGLEAS